MIDRCAPQTPVEFGVRHPSFSIISLMSFSCLREFVENSRHPKTPARVREGLVSGFWHRNPGNALDPLDPRMSSKTCKTRMFFQWFAPPHPPMKTYFKDAPRSGWPKPSFCLPSFWKKAVWVQGTGLNWVDLCLEFGFVHRETIPNSKWGLESIARIPALTCWSAQTIMVQNLLIIWRSIWVDVHGSCRPTWYHTQFDMWAMFVLC